ncbi:MAG: isocitrate/isopropylmalate family dehydrogenase, partial [Candidatus Lokiarchaeota archaeon]|nr:isocitrate/isopropylmalate family dehydrogenase [Candidatus Lokiarchaeota archaeon]
MEDVVQKAKDHFEGLVRVQLKRIEDLKKGADWIDYSTLKPLIIGIASGDYIGPEITKHAENILKFLLKEEVESGKIQFKDIVGLTIENRAKLLKAIPDDVVTELKKCHVILKGPTHTPSSADLTSGKWPNLESANVSMRRELDLFANVRPVKVPELGIDWIFFRENTEGAYALGSKGILVTEDLAFDFCVHTKQGTDRILRLAF